MSTPELEGGIMAGCTILLLVFTMAMEVILWASQWFVGGEKINPELWLPPIRAYMDYMTSLTTTKACTRWLLKKLQENIELARMKIKPNKYRSISLIKGRLSNHSFYWGRTHSQWSWRNQLKVWDAGMMRPSWRHNEWNRLSRTPVVALRELTRLCFPAD